LQISGLGISMESIDMQKVKEKFRTLNARERTVIRHLTGFEGVEIKSLNAIAEELGISRERARQVAIIAIGKMDAALQEDKDDVVEQLANLAEKEYGGEFPSSFDVKINHAKLYWKIRGTFGEYKKVQALAEKKLREKHATAFDF